jgi:hypothetical protein
LFCRAADEFEEVALDGRLVELCVEHAELVRRGRISSVAQLRQLFAEPFGRRSLVERREFLDRRMFPPRPEGRRRYDGRRATDSEG